MSAQQMNKKDEKDEKDEIDPLDYDNFEDYSKAKIGETGKFKIELMFRSYEEISKIICDSVIEWHIAWFVKRFALEMVAEEAMKKSGIKQNIDKIQLERPRF